MKTQFVPPYMPSSHTVGGWNYRHYGVMDWCDDCCYPYYNYHEGEFNPVRQYWSNHYKSFKRLYEKLYDLGFVCTNQKEALSQVLKRPLNKITFTYYWFKWFHFHWKPKLFLNTDGSITNNTNMSTPDWADIRLFWPRKELLKFSRKLNKQNKEDLIMCKDDKLAKAIQNAKKAEKAAKQAEKLVKQYKNHGKKQEYLVVLSYDNAAAQSSDNNLFAVEQLDKFGGITEVSTHCLIKDYNVNRCDQTYWFSSYKKACQRVSILKKSSLNTPHILSYLDFKDIVDELLFSL